MKKKLSELARNPLISGSTIMIFGSNSVSFINYLYHFVMGRMLGPAGYGELATLIALIGLLGTIPSSMNLVIVKFISSAKNDQELDGYVKWFKTYTLKTSIYIFILVMIISPFANSFLHTNNISFMVIIAVSFLFSLSSIFNRAIMQGLLEFKQMILSILAENLVKLIIIIILVYIGFQVGGALFSFVVAAAIGWFITNLYLKNYDSKKVVVAPKLKTMLFFIFPVLIQTITITSIYSSDLVLVKHFFTSHDAGLYASISTLGKIIFFGASPVSAAMFPLIAQRSARGSSYMKIFIYSFLATSLISFGILFLFWASPSFSINLLYGKQYLEGARLLPLYGIFMVLFTLSSLVTNFCLSLGRTRAVVFPLIAAILQIIFITIYHQSLFVVITVSIIINALLLVLLLIYSIYGSKFNFNNSSRLQTAGNNS